MAKFEYIIDGIKDGEGIYIFLFNIKSDPYEIEETPTEEMELLAELCTFTITKKDAQSKINGEGVILLLKERVKLIEYVEAHPEQLFSVVEKLREMKLPRKPVQKPRQMIFYPLNSEKGYPI